MTDVESTVKHTVQRPPAVLRMAALSFMLDARFGIATPFVRSHLGRTSVELRMTP